MNAYDSVTYNSDDNMYYAADNTGFSMLQDAIDYNIGTLGLTTGDLMQPAGSTNDAGLDPANGITGPINTMNAGSTPTSASPNGWDFLGGLLNTTMQTAGQIIVSNVNAGLQNVATQYSPKPAPKPVVKPTGSNTGIWILLGVVGLVAVGGVAASRRR